MAKTVACRCSIYRFTHDKTEYTTGCTRTTTRTFAQGHDAKLKGFLIHAGSVGADVVREVGGIQHIGDAVKQASEYGFAHMVRDAIQARLDGMAARAARKDAPKEPAGPPKKASPKSTKRPEAPIEGSYPKKASRAKGSKAKATNDPAPSGEAVREDHIRVGRWWHKAVIFENGAAMYKTQSGAQKTVQKGQYSVGR